MRTTRPRRATGTGSRVARRWGVARVWAVLVGGVYLAIAATEAVARDALAPALTYAAANNALHWTIGAIALLSFLGPERTARSLARLVGAALALLAAWAAVSPRGLGALLGHADGIPLASTILYLLTAATFLLVGFAPPASGSSRGVGRLGTPGDPDGRSVTIDTVAIEFTDWAVDILGRSHEAARRFNPDAVVRLFRRGEEVAFELTDEPRPGDERVEHERFALLVEAGLEGVVDVVEPHDRLILRPPGSTERSVRGDHVGGGPAGGPLPG